jgi:hypothetical protein
MRFKALSYQNDIIAHLIRNNTLKTLLFNQAILLPLLKD